MSRTFTVFAKHDPDARALVDALATLKGDIPNYRDTMRRIGQHLAAGILPEVSGSTAHLCVVCTVEDADFLARGVLEALESSPFEGRVHMLCLWNHRVKHEGLSASPVMRSYEEAFDADNAIFIVVKSIISGACVVKTNLTRVISKGDPKRVFIASPVMLEGAEARLAREFPDEIAQKFEYIHFATDTEKHGDDVVPGIGGSVYELLGLGNSVEKNRYVPAIVRERRRRLFAGPQLA